MVPIDIIDSFVVKKQTYEQRIAKMRGMTVPYISNQSRDERIQWQRLPVVGVVSLEDGDRFGEIGVYPFSHKNPLEDKHGIQLLNARILEYRSDELILLDPLTVHFGCPYPQDNMRMHIYVNNPDFVRSLYDRTTGENVTITSATKYKRNCPTVPPKSRQQSITYSRLGKIREYKSSNAEHMEMMRIEKKQRSNERKGIV